MLLGRTEKKILARSSDQLLYIVRLVEMNHDLMPHSPSSYLLRCQVILFVML